MNEKVRIEKVTDEVSFEMLLAEGGSFLMGSEDEEAFDDEQPVHKVTVESFYIGKYPVVQELWRAVMGNNLSEFQAYNRPVEMVSWEDTQAFIQKLNVRTGQAYRLLSEAEWEYAARGGSQGQGYRYAGSNKLKDVGWYAENSIGETKPAGLKYPNELGLYDISGNVLEWVEDDWHDSYRGAPTDGSAWTEKDWGSKRVIRGGGWDYVAWYCRVAYRDSNDPTNRDNNVGFRLGLSLQSVG